MTTPFRERPPMLACPRCGEILNEVTGDVSMCGQCGGLWLGQPAIITAFQDPTWPHGVSMWWRRELVCPECATGGIDQTMSAVVVDDLLLLDRCIDHGIWFDRGELARLIGGSASKELEMIKKILESEKTPAWVVAQQHVRDAERQQRELEAYRAEVATREAREAEATAARNETARKERDKQLREELGKERAQLERDVATIVARLTTLRETIDTEEKRMREVRSRLRMVESQLASLGMSG